MSLPPVISDHPSSVSLLYVPPSQRPGSEASVAALQSSAFAPPSLSSIASSLLPVPSWPNAPISSDSIHAPVPGPSTTTNKGKAKAQSPDTFQNFVFPNGHQGFHDLCDTLLHLQTPLRDAMSIASMENQSDAIISMAHLQDIDNWLNMLLSMTNKAEKSIDFCQVAAQLPPYPALGLAWTALANNSTSINMASSKAIHSLVNSITLVNINKTNTSE